MKIMVSYFLATAFSLAVVVSPVVYAQDKQARDTMNRAAGVARFDRMHEARSPTDEAVKLLSSGNAASLAKADPRSIALLQFLLSEFKQYELNVTYGGGRNSHPDKRFQGGRRIEDFMKYVSDPARIARTPGEVLQYLTDPRNQWEIKSTLGEFGVMVGEEIATHAVYHLLVEAGAYLLGVGLGAGGFVVAPVLSMPNDLGHQPQSDADDYGEGEERGLGINGGPSILDGRPQDSRFNNGRGSGRSASNNERSHHQRDDSGDSGVSSSNPSYQQSRNQRNYEPRDSQGSGASNGNSDQPPTSGTQGGGASNGNSDQPPTSGTQGDKDVPTESMRGYPSMEAYESGHPGRALRERLIDDPLTGHNRRSSAGKGDDLGARDLPRGAPDKRSARNQMDVRQDPARSPLPGSQGPDDSEQPRFPGSDNNRARATRGDNDLGNDLPLRSQNMGGPSVAPFAESLWWQRNGPRAQPPK